VQSVAALAAISAVPDYTQVEGQVFNVRPVNDSTLILERANFPFFDDSPSQALVEGSSFEATSLAVVCDATFSVADFLAAAATVPVSIIDPPADPSPAAPTAALSASEPASAASSAVQPAEPGTSMPTGGSPSSEQGLESAGCTRSVPVSIASAEELAGAFSAPDAQQGTCQKLLVLTADKLCALSHLLGICNYA
jgi:hypothetical protein